MLVCDEGDAMACNVGGPSAGLGLALIDRVTERYELASRQPLPGLQVQMVFAIG